VWLIVELGLVAKITPCNRELAAIGLSFSLTSNRRQQLSAEAWRQFARLSFLAGSFGRSLDLH
jgi:hypothetical protein